MSFNLVTTLIHMVPLCSKDLWKFGNKLKVGCLGIFSGVGRVGTSSYNIYGLGKCKENALLISHNSRLEEKARRGHFSTGTFGTWRDQDKS